MRRLTEKQTQRFDPVEVSEQRGLRTLHFAGGVAQSVMRVRDPVALELEYTRAAMLFAVLHPGARDIALIGLGGGSLAKFIHRHLPNAHLTALEINPEVVAAARSYFHLPPDDAHLTTITGDGAAWMAAQHGTQDALILDGYDRKRIVAALSSAEFYRACHSALRPGGWAVFNLWAEEGRFHLYREAIEAAFDGPAWVLPTEQKGNLLVFAQRAPAPAPDPTEVMGRARELTTWGFDVTALAARLFA
jgi:spermidine synthase